MSTPRNAPTCTRPLGVFESLMICGPLTRSAMSSVQHIGGRLVAHEHAMSRAGRRETRKEETLVRSTTVERTRALVVVIGLLDRRSPALHSLERGRILRSFLALDDRRALRGDGVRVDEGNLH